MLAHMGRSLAMRQSTVIMPVDGCDPEGALAGGALAIGWYPAAVLVSLLGSRTDGLVVP
jgi:hypothetical protein